MARNEFKKVWVQNAVKHDVKLDSGQVLKPGQRVKLRGIMLNDENLAFSLILSNWKGGEIVWNGPEVRQKRIQEEQERLMAGYNAEPEEIESDGPEIDADEEDEGDSKADVTLDEGDSKEETADDSQEKSNDGASDETPASDDARGGEEDAGGSPEETGGGEGGDSGDDPDPDDASSGDAPEPDRGSDETESGNAAASKVPEEFVGLNSKDGQKYILALESIEVLDAIDAHERAGESRKGILKTIEKRKAQLEEKQDA